MSDLANVAIHSSQFPAAVRLELVESLQSRRINHKFHYDSFKQAQKWLALHEAYSPARTDPACVQVYDQSFSAVIQRLKPGGLQVIGLGCGGGQKDAALLKLLKQAGRAAVYIPADVGLAMVLVARQAALVAAPGTTCFPLMCDLATARDLPSVVDALAGSGRVGVSDKHLSEAGPTRLFTFFGMLPNFEPEIVLPNLASLIQRDDLLLLSANLAPGNDYASGVEHVLPLYDNELTRDWLMTFLLDLGVEKGDGELRFVVEDRSTPVPLKRMAAYFRFTRTRTVPLDSERFQFSPGESVRLFFSYRHTPALVSATLNQHGLTVRDQWITESQEEGVFLVSRTGAPVV